MNYRHKYSFDMHPNRPAAETFCCQTGSAIINLYHKFYHPKLRPKYYITICRPIL